mmetsp:Transcript_20779/g.29969  ORF Transcript_20779/g.29969 Transcript_20779/m.29969 type:complete len:97 (-) Transcript_20779:166-456(-)
MTTTTTSTRNMNSASSQPSALPASFDNTITGRECSHVFHRHCIMDWLLLVKANVQKNSSCPECRQPMWDQKDYQKAKGKVMEIQQQEEREQEQEKV